MRPNLTGIAAWLAIVAGLVIGITSCHGTFNGAALLAILLTSGGAVALDRVDRNLSEDDS